MKNTQCYKNIFFQNKIQFVFVAKCLQYKSISVIENSAKTAKARGQQTEYDTANNLSKQTLHLGTIYVYRTTYMWQRQLL